MLVKEKFITASIWKKRMNIYKIIKNLKNLDTWKNAVISLKF